MIITCPSCDAQYLLPENAIGEKGRRVKCTSCEYTWLQMPEIIEIAYEDSAEEKVFTAPETLETKDNTDEYLVSQYAVTQQSPMIRVLTDGIMYALCALIVTGILLVSFADKIVASWPESALFYEVLQIPVAPPGQGIEFRDLKIATTATAEKSGDVAITGLLVNASQHFIRLPSLRVDALGNDDKVLKNWTINLGSTALSAGKEASLDYVLQDAPAGTSRIKLIFID